MFLRFLQLNEATECAIKLLLSVGAKLESERSVDAAAARQQQQQPGMSGEKVIEHSTAFLTEKCRPRVIKRVQFAVDDFMETKNVRFRIC